MDHTTQRIDTDAADDHDAPEPDAAHQLGGASDADGPPRPVVWAALSSDEAEYEWLRLNEWVEDLRHVFAIPPQIIPPFWHRHPVLVEHLSALHTHWLAAYDPAQHGSAPFGWVKDLDEWKHRMREQVAAIGTRLDADRPQRLTPWPGEPEPDPEDTPPPVNLADRYEDFVTHLLWQVERRKIIEDRYYQLIADDADDDL
ncbi:MAG: hypothetical protein LBO20_01315 [Bifidobacteriaceae bacterium]|jgi:hypothetical protein|nr:hypothetical protein [Bifidobacteriaceae bacterium]